MARRGRAGTYLTPRLYVADDGNVWAYRDDRGGLNGLSSAWDIIGQIVKPITTGIGTYIATKNQPQIPAYQQPIQGVQVGAGSGGLFAGIDTTTILVIGLAVFLFMSQRSK